MSVICSLRMVVKLKHVGAILMCILNCKFYCTPKQVYSALGGENKQVFVRNLHFLREH